MEIHLKKMEANDFDNRSTGKEMIFFIAVAVIWLMGIMAVILL
jgi:hypothetical protein